LRKKKKKNYYELFRDKNLELLGALRSGFVSRMKTILDQSQTLDNASPDFIIKLSAIEKQCTFDFDFFNSFKNHTYFFFFFYF